MRRTSEHASERLVRLLGIVSFLSSHEEGQVRIDELATHFQVTPAQIAADIDQLWVTGTPGYFPDDLIDFNADFEEGTVTLTQARGLTRPLRLGTREAVALTAALRAMGEVLAEALDPARAAVIASALAKLTGASGEAASRALDVRLAQESDPEVGNAVGRALMEQRQVQIRYVTATDVVSTRIIDPVQVRTEDENSYLVAWCTRAQDFRSFRLDRILHAEMLTTRAGWHDPDAAAGRDAFRPEAEDERVRIEFTSQARWIAEQVPNDGVSEREDGGFEVLLGVTDPLWLRHLLLSNAKHVTALCPEWARADVHEAASQALAAYGL